MTFPALNHVALTVRDLDVSVPWYRAADRRGPGDRRGHRRRIPACGVGLRQRHPLRHPPTRARRPRRTLHRVPRRGWTMSASDARIAPRSNAGSNDSTPSGSSTAESSTRATGPGSVSAIPTASRWSSSRRRAEWTRRVSNLLPLVCKCRPPCPAVPACLDTRSAPRLLGREPPATHTENAIVTHMLRSLAEVARLQ